MSSEFLEIELSKIRPNRLNPRLTVDLDRLNELADSIKQVGLIEPIIVRPIEDGYEVVVGERRYRASQQVGLKKIPAIVREYSDYEVIELNLIENVQREDLSAVEKGNSCLLLREKFPSKYPSFLSIARKMGLDVSTINVWIQVAGMPKEIQSMIATETESRRVPTGKIDYWTAAKLGKIKDPAKQVTVAQTLVERRIKGTRARQIISAVVKQPDRPIAEILDSAITGRLKSQIPVFFDKNTGNQTKVEDGTIIVQFEKTPPPVEKTDVVCPHFMELKWATGCPYDCAWCYLQGTFRHFKYGTRPYFKDRSMIHDHVRFFLQTYPPRILNSGELCDSLMRDPKSKTTFPEFIIPIFENQNPAGHKILFLTKSDRVDDLLGIEKHDHAIMSFTLNALPVSERWEKGAPPTPRRIEAAKKVFDAGYETRIRIDPMVPIEGWKEHYLSLVDRVMNVFLPERITLGSLRGLQSTINEATDKSWVEYLSERSGWGLKIPLGQRFEMYKVVIDHLKEKYDYVDVGLCKETLEMWQTLDMNWRECKCNCVW